jgi:signal transduction histidine kinase
MVAALVRHRYARRMQRKLQKLAQAHAIEQERMRIARDIHDDLGARLTQMAFLSEMTAGEIGGHGQASERLEKIATGSRQAIRSLEEIVWAINPRKDSLSDFLDFLSHYANEFFHGTAIRCRQDLPLIIPEIPLSSEMRHHLFLACKETLNNIHKHAGATEVWLRMKVNETDLEVAIEDNGQGFEPSSKGLMNQQTRLAAIGGRCQVDSQPGCGTSVRFTIKLPESPATQPH